ncbi:cytochrome C554 [candidate division KSB1 bacterium]|nr:cytochrome C554 [candidate division KSB1 bacterium]RQW06123.1 MAG: cytochrome C554 [candidate division KSB1 bacterium]
MNKKVALCAVVGTWTLIVTFLAAGDAHYIGAHKCMICHKSPSRGDQWGKWSNGPHIKAFETLKSEQSMAIAQKMGINDPTQADKCLKCHVTAHGAPAARLAADFSFDEGVGCEACHGPGSLYKSMQVMKALRDGTQDPKEVEFNKGDEATCLTCHNEESPTYRPFNYAKAWAKIAHNIPE